MRVGEGRKDWSVLWIKHEGAFRSGEGEEPAK